jgi:hypothetical protein
MRAALLGERTQARKREGSWEGKGEEEEEDVVGVSLRDVRMPARMQMPIVPGLDLVTCLCESCELGREHTAAEHSHGDRLRGARFTHVDG